MLIPGLPCFSDTVMKLLPPKGDRKKIKSSISLPTTMIRGNVKVEWAGNSVTSFKMTFVGLSSSRYDFLLQSDFCWRADKVLEPCWLFAHLNHLFHHSLCVFPEHLCVFFFLNNCCKFKATSFDTKINCTFSYDILLVLYKMPYVTSCIQANSFPPRAFGRKKRRKKM